MIKAAIFGNLRVKLMALAMAIALWFFAINRYTEEITEVIDVEILMPPEFTILSQSTNSVIVSLKGPLELIDQVSNLISDQKIKVRCQIPLNIDGLNDPIKKTITISRNNLNIPDDIKIESIYPDRVDVEFSRLEKRYLHVNLQKKGHPAAGYTIENELIYPGELEVVGPSSLLKLASHINTKPIDITGITTEKNKTFPWTIDIEQNIEIKRDGKTLLVPVKCDEQVRVWFSISELQEAKTLENVKIAILRPADYPYQVTLQDENVNLTVKGPKLMVNKLTKEDVSVYVDVSLLKPPGPYKQRVHVSLPSGIVIKGQAPEVHIDLKAVVNNTE
ncbi:MAG: CdaR family protein [Candidatus Anammoxibacter sp.]